MLYQAPPRIFNFIFIFIFIFIFNFIFIFHGGLRRAAPPRRRAGFGAGSRRAFRGCLWLVLIGGSNSCLGSPGTTKTPVVELIRRNVVAPIGAPKVHGSVVAPRSATHHKFLLFSWFLVFFFHCFILKRIIGHQNWTASYGSRKNGFSSGSRSTSLSGNPRLIY